MSSTLSRVNRSAAGVAICLLLAGSPALAHTIDILELPNGGGTRAITDGNILNTFPNSETISAGVNFNDGNYVPQVINVNLYDDLAHTIVSDRFTITVPVQNPPQITVGLTSETAGVPLEPLTPETIGLTETGALQNVITLTNSNGIETTVRIQSLEEATPTATPEPASVLLTAAGLIGLAIRRSRRSKKAAGRNVRGSLG
jgi:PEP-CTERM motif-containing protein